MGVTPFFDEIALPKERKSKAILSQCYHPITKSRFKGYNNLFAHFPAKDEGVN